MVEAFEGRAGPGADTAGMEYRMRGDTMLRNDAGHTIPLAVARSGFGAAVLVALVALLAACTRGPAPQQLEAASERAEAFTRLTLEGNWEGAHNNLEPSYRNDCSTTAFRRQLQEAIGERPEGFTWEEPRPGDGMTATVVGTARTVSGTEVPLSLGLAYLPDDYVWVITELTVRGGTICS